MSLRGDLCRPAGDVNCAGISGKSRKIRAHSVDDADNVPVSASFKTSDEDFGVLPSRQGFIPAPYMAKNKWIFVDDISRFSRKDWETYLRKAYDIIAAKLPLKLQKQIAGGIVVSKPAVKKKATVRKKVVKKKTSSKKKVTSSKKRK